MGDKLRNRVAIHVHKQQRRHEETRKSFSEKLIVAFIKVKVTA